jgi:YD repeat-containing protein
MTCFLRVGLSLFASIAFAIALSAQSPVRYVYDELGRLVGVIDGAGDAAMYHYDAVGNLLSITRFTSTQLSVIEFTPNTGPIGQTVSIHGTGFSATPSQNTVSFNGTTAAISSASTNTLVVAVPAGATTGAISVTSPNGSANSLTSFVVSASSAPTITGTSPGQGSSGTSVTISGTNFQTQTSQNLITFNATPAPVSSATGTAIGTSVPPTATSGKVSVATPFGAATGSTDFIIPPSPLVSGDIETTYRMTPGNSQVVTISTANKVALVLFDATTGQRVSLHVSTGPTTAVRLYNYDGLQLGSTVVGGSSGFIDVQTLTATASYTIVVDPIGTATGSLTLTLYNVPPDITGTIPEDGTNHGVTMSTPGQNARVTFSGAAAQRVSLKVSAGPTGNVFVYKPDRSLLASVAIGPVFPTFIDTQALPTTGLYAIVVDYGGTSTGSVTLNLFTVPADTTSPITPNGSAVTLTTTTPGQNGTATFTGTSAHRMSLWITNVSSSTTAISLLDSAGASLGSVSAGIFGAFLEPITLAQSGGHSILMDPSGANTGSVTLRLYDIPIDVTGSVTINAGGSNVSLPGPGQIASYTFSGTASQQVTVRITNSDIDLPTGTGTTVTVSLLRANGTVLTSTTSGGTTFNLATQTLPATETYTVRVDPTGPGIGTLTVAVTNP